MLRIAGRRLSSLSWRSNQTAAPASVSSYRNLIGGGGDSKMTSDESKSDITNFTSRSAFLYSTRVFWWDEMRLSKI
ncbi:hypothetical protein C5167_022136 [Papaver somniferum]|uniref:Uncharacterized protein n=1 Tax=Papaver somniferum TaxID=3469 RepID=A0A4Y7JIJ1_PAPSO|nr:hypothetical protein C5167_022136 [Papaver somniferum]